MHPTASNVQPQCNLAHIRGGGGRFSLCHVECVELQGRRTDFFPNTSYRKCIRFAPLPLRPTPPPPPPLSYAPEVPIIKHSLLTRRDVFTGIDDCKLNKTSNSKVLFRQLTLYPAVYCTALCHTSHFLFFMNDFRKLHMTILRYAGVIVFP